MNIATLFDRCATEYERDRPKLVPCFEHFYGAAMRMIPFPPDAPLRVLDLGAGTGLFAAMVAQAYPNAVLRLTDISEAMLDVARQRFVGNSQISFAVQEHLELGEESVCDLVISALSIHHLEHEVKRELFGKIFRALRPGGVFINADQALGPTPEEEATCERQWFADATANGATTDAIEAAKERMRADRNATLADQLCWLEEAGFGDVRCAYARYRFVVYGGRRMGIE
jgi:tRNA (cmo5U34)-methyltransferase